MSTNLGDATCSVNSFHHTAASLNFNIPNFVADGVIHRFDRQGKKNAWYIAFEKNFSGRKFVYARFGDWKTQERHEWKTGGDISSSDAAEMRKLIEEAVASQEEEKARLRLEAKETARQMWELAEEKPTPYTEKKSCRNLSGTRTTKDLTLLIPTMVAGEMVGLQRIWPNGDKYFLKGQEAKGCYFQIGGGDASYVCEGWATGVSIHEATGKSVIVCFSAGNLKEISRKVPHATIAADNDRFTEGNPGVTAARKCGLNFIAPEFPPGDDESTDFNDLHLKYGINVVRQQLKEWGAVVNNVVGIRSKTPGVAKKKMSDVYKAICDAMTGRNVGAVPDFPVQFHIVEPSPGSRLIAQESEPQVIHYVSEKAVVQAILQYAHNLYMPRTGDNVGFEYKHASECMKFWRSFADPIPEPKMVSWPGEDGYTLRRLPWTLQEGPTPLFDELIDRTSNPNALRCFIGSLFFPEADLQQYVWIFGQGQNGKGALSRFLKRALNGAYTAQMVPAPNDKFWTSGLIGARLVVFPDCNNRTFVASGLFKSLTGGDPIKIEQKGQQPFTTELKAKYLFLSNERPHISSEKADTRRAIFCEMDTIQCDPRPGYEDELWTEGGMFLAKCFITYMKSCPNHNQIPTFGEDQHLKDWISTLEEEFEVAVQKHFIIDLRRSCTPAEFQKQLDLVWKNNKKTQQEFRSWLERQYGVRKSCRKSDGKVSKIYSGIEVIKNSTFNIGE